MAVTLGDVAARAGASRSAVSRAFTPGAPISAEMRRRVEAAAEELGYRPNVLAAARTTGRTRLIGIVTDAGADPFQDRAQRILTAALQDASLHALPIQLTDADGPGAIRGLLKSYGADGAVLLTTSRDSAFAVAVQGEDMPVVQCFQPMEQGPQIDIIGVSDRQVGQIAGRCLAGLGSPEIGLITGPREKALHHDRIAAFAAVLDQHGIGLRHLPGDGESFEAGFSGMQSELRTNPARAYFCVSDMLALGAMIALLRAGKDVPGDIALLGMGNLEMTQWRGLNLSTLRVPVLRMMRAAVERLETRIADPSEPPRSFAFPVKLMPRSTTPRGGRG